LLLAAFLWPAAGAWAQAGDPPAPQPQPPQEQRLVRATFERAERPGRAKLLRLRIEGLTVGMQVTVRCRGRGCRAPRRLGTARGTLMNGKRAFPGRLVLRRGARLDVSILREDGGTDVVRYVVGRRGRVRVQTLSVGVPLSG
jgi:hypothetical protein